MIECEYAGVDPPSPPGVWSTPLSSVISLLGGRLLVLSSEAEIAAHYTDHRPVAGQFSVSRPYQQSSPAALTIAGQTIPGLTSDTSVPQPPAGVHFTGVFDGPSIHGLPIADLDGSLHRPQSTDLSGSEGNGGAEITPRVRRKRKRGVARAPNIAEEQVRGSRGQIWYGSLIMSLFAYTRPVGVLQEVLLPQFSEASNKSDQLASWNGPHYRPRSSKM